MYREGEDPVLRGFCALVLVAAVVASGCGGDGGSVRGVSPEGSEAADAGGLELRIDPEVLAVAGVIVDRLGRDEGFDAVALALDAGYGVDQIAGNASGLMADGVIQGVDPSGAGSGLFALGFDGGMVLAAPNDLVLADGDDLEFLRDRFRVAASATGAESEEEIGAFMVGMLMHLVAVGYSLDQIVEGIVFQEVRLTSWYRYSWENFACFALAADDGSLVAPELVPPAFEVWNDATACHERIWEGDVGFFAGCENDVYGICTEGEAVAGSTTTTTMDPQATGQRSYRLEGFFVVAGEGAEVSATWTGGFDTVDGELEGSGRSTATSEGTCRIGDGTGYRYDFTAAWEFEVSGVSNEENLQIILTPESATAQITAGAGTELEATCVGFAREFLAGFTANPLGVGPPYEIVVPISGGSTRVGADPLLIDFTIQPVS